MIHGLVGDKVRFSRGKGMFHQGKVSLFNKSRAKWFSQKIAERTLNLQDLRFAFRKELSGESKKIQWCEWNGPRKARLFSSS